MAPRALHTSEDDFLDDYARVEFYTGERICAPLKTKSRASKLLQAMIVLAALGVSGWAVLNYRGTIESWLEPITRAMASAMEQSARQAAGPQATATPTPPEELPAAPREVVEAPGADAGTVVQTEPAKVATSDDGIASAEHPAPLPPPKADPADPYQKRALAAGLHPELSRAVLTRLTEKDFSNAALAIRTALKEMPEKGSYLYPKKAGYKGAVFEVRFVAAADAACRRYIVVVTLDRWSSTAPAMEKCGGELHGRGTKSAAAG